MTDVSMEEWGSDADAEQKLKILQGGLITK